MSVRGGRLLASLLVLLLAAVGVRALLAEGEVGLPPIAFSKQTAVRQYDIAVNAGGSTMVLTQDALSHLPSWSPDGQQIAFVRGVAGSFEECCGYGEEQVWVMNADGSDPHVVSTSGLDPMGRPQWTDDGDHLAFFIYPDDAPKLGDASQVVVLSLTTGDWQTIGPLLTTNEAVLSESGSAVAWLDQDAIQVVDLTTGEKVQEAPGVFSMVTSMSFSPEGDWLAVTGSAEGTAPGRVWAWNFEANQLVPVEVGRGEGGGFTWTGANQLLYCYTTSSPAPNNESLQEQAVRLANLSRWGAGQKEVTGFANTSDSCFVEDMDARLVRFTPALD